MFINNLQEGNTIKGKLQCQFAEAVTRGCQHQTPRKTDGRDLVSCILLGYKYFLSMADLRNCGFGLVDCHFLLTVFISLSTVTKHEKNLFGQEPVLQ